MAFPRRATSFASLLLATASLIATGCSTSGNSASTATVAAGPTDACDLLHGELDLGDGRVRPTGDRVIRTVLGMAESSRREVRVYLDPTLEEEALRALDAQVAGRSGVRSTHRVDRDQTFADFRQLFADNERMLDSVEPSDLPMSVSVVIETDHADDLIAWARHREDVYEVVDHPRGSDVGEFSGWLQRQADRDELRRFARQLEALDGQPSWAKVTATLLEQAHADGTEALATDREQVGEATESLASQLGSC